MYAKEIVEGLKNVDVNAGLFRDCVLAVVTADYLKGTNDKSLDIDLFCSEATVNTYGRELHEYLGLPVKRGISKILPHVQLLRVVCDALFIHNLEKDLSVEDLRLMNECSYLVANVDGHKYKRTGYAEYEECKGVLENYFNSLKTYKTLEELYKKYLEDKTEVFSIGTSKIKMPKLACSSSDVTIDNTLEIQDEEGYFYSEFIPALLTNITSKIEEIYNNNHSLGLGVMYRAYGKLQENLPLPTFSAKICRSKELSDYYNLFFKASPGYSYGKIHYDTLKTLADSIEETEGLLNNGNK